MSLHSFQILCSYPSNRRLLPNPNKEKSPYIKKYQTMKFSPWFVRLESSDVSGRFRYEMSTQLLHLPGNINLLLLRKGQSLWADSSWWVSRHHLSFCPVLAGTKSVVLHVSQANNKRNWGFLEEFKCQYFMEAPYISFFTHSTVFTFENNEEMKNDEKISSRK